MPDDKIDIFFEYLKLHSEHLEIELAHCKELLKHPQSIEYNRGYLEGQKAAYTKAIRGLKAVCIDSVNVNSSAKLRIGD